ncbi:hypothetical protein J3E68DRAFT_393915 [Trichoderma sp. SZMC 28012]
MTPCKPRAFPLSCASSFSSFFFFFFCPPKALLVLRFSSRQRPSFVRLGFCLGFSSTLVSGFPPFARCFDLATRLGNRQASSQATLPLTSRW